MQRIALARFIVPLLLIAFLPVAARAEIKLWVETPGVMIMPDRQPGESTAIKIIGVRNEYVSAQIALRSDQAENDPASFSASALSGGENNAVQIPASEITLYRAADIVVDHYRGASKANDPARARPLGSFPDALVPLIGPDGANVANAIKAPANQTLSFWVDIHIPAGTKSGDYTGQIGLFRNGMVIKSIPVALYVANAEIPAESTIPSVYNLRPYTHCQANLGAYVAEMIRHRIQPTNTHYLDYMEGAGEKPDRGFPMLDKYNPGGKGWVSIYVGATSRKDEKNVIDLLKQAVDHLDSLRMLDRTFIYLHDEPDASDLQGMVDVANDIIAAIPRLKGHFLDTLNKDDTVLDPLLTYDARALKMYGGWYAQKAMDGRAEWDKHRAAGEQLWFYVSNAQGVPFPTFDVNTPNLGFEPRVMGWAWWYEKASGHLYWDLMSQESWQLNRKFPPGDGQLIYPGNFSLPGAPDFVLVKDLHGPVVSRRLKEFRQGLQEWELLKEAEQKVGREKVQAIVDKVYTCMGRRTWAPDAYDPAKPMWSYKESDWDDARGQIIQLLSN